MSKEFVIGVSPFLFLVKGGPRPAFFPEMQNAFVELVAVYEEGPEQRGHVAYREYNFWEKISRIMSDTFFQNIEALSNHEPLQMFEAVPGSGCMDRFEELYAKAKHLRNNGGPGSLKEMKQAAVAHALRDGRYFRLETSAGRGVDDPKDTTDANPTVGQATPAHQGMALSGDRNQPHTPTRMHQTVAHPYLRTARLPAAFGQTRPPIYVSTGNSAASGSRNIAVDVEVPPGSQGASVSSLRRLKGMGSDEIYKELLARPKERLRPACEECDKADEVCYSLEGMTRKNGKRPACIRCRAWSRKCSNCDLDEEYVEV